jgi:hypothetical protein
MHTLSFSVRLLAGAVLFIFLTIVYACAADRKYGGRVIDADTKAPLKGAVVVAVWDEERATIAGPSSRVKEIKEILTNDMGEWSIIGPEGDEEKAIGWLQPLGVPMTKAPRFVVFKPGYCSWPAGFGIQSCKEKLKPSGVGGIYDGETIELPKVIKYEDRQRSLPGPIYPARFGGFK